MPEARQRISALVGSWNVPLSDEQVAEVELPSTEMIANAVRHTKAPCAVALRRTGVRVRAEITDASPVRPKPRHGALDAEGRRGLLLVDALAADWGSTHDPDPRRRVPLANLQIADGRWVLGLDPGQLREVAAKLREHADVLDQKIRPALIAARDDWAAHLRD